ncbi:MAG: ECF transporter S component [Clostridia bacterium]
MDTKVKNGVNVRSIVTASLMVALTFLATMCINIRLPIAANGGLVHLGNVPLIVAAIIFGKKQGAIAGAFGMALFDLVSGWTLWAPFTFVIVGTMGYLIGAICENKKNIGAWYVLAMVVAVAVKIAGYYVAEAIIFGNWLVPAASIPGNIVQVGAAAIVSLPLVLALRRVVSRRGVIQ